MDGCPFNRGIWKMAGMRKLCAWFGAAALASSATAPIPAAAQQASPLVADSFRIGSQGALCEAEGVAMGDARASVFDRKWALVCADVDRPVGSASSWRSNAAADGFIGRGRDVQLDCGDAGSVAGAGVDVAGATLRQCRDKASGLAWNVYSATTEGRVHVVEGLAAFDAVLRLTLASLAENRQVPGTLDIVTTGTSGSLAEARAALGDGSLLIGQGYRRNNAGEYVEAEEFFRPELLEQASLDAGAVAETAPALIQRHEALANRALQLSNLGRYEEAGRQFALATAMGLRDPIQARLLRNFEAIDALNQRQLDRVAEILDRPVPPFDASVTGAGGALQIDRVLAASINSGANGNLADSLGQDTRLTPMERAALIDAQALQVRGTALRLAGRNDEALARLSSAIDAIAAVKNGRVLSAARLQSQTMAEMAATHEAQGRMGDAESLLRQSLALNELRYPQTAAVDGARARLAAFLTRAGQNDAALVLYRQVMRDVAGKRSALVGIEGQLLPYFTMLADGAVQNEALALELFGAAQLVDRPGAAQTMAQLSRSLAAGTGEAADLFRRSTALDRDLARTNLAIASVQAGEDGTSPAQLPDLTARRDRLEQAQAELLTALSAYPEFRSISHQQVTAQELRTTLKPGEAYLKLVRLGDAMFATYLSPGTARAWKLGASSGEIGDLVANLRDSISLTINGVNATYPFDVDSARALNDVLLAPVAADLAGVRHLVFEPDGPLLQLPLNLLVTENAGVDAYHRRVADGGDEYDFTGIAWLGRTKAVSTALSVTSFRDARRAPPSAAMGSYLGFGNNRPVGSLTRASLVRGLPQMVDAGCEVPLAAWNQPIPATELFQASAAFAGGRTDVVTGGNFTDTSITARRDLDQYRIVHFATHGLVTAPEPGCPARPALLTSFGDTGSDGLLQFGDIFDLDLDADLVILSACDTAAMAGATATREAGLEGGGSQALDGLVRAFIGAGGRQIIASHWPAPEQFNATGRLFAGLFSAPAGADMGTALMQAQLPLMDDPLTSHPFYWSGFALIGDGARPLISGR